MSDRLQQTRAHIVASAASLPERYYPQRRLADTIAEFITTNKLRFPVDLIHQLFENVRIAGRYFEFSVEGFCAPPLIADSAALAIEACVRHSEANVRRILSETGLRARDVSMLASVTLTPAVPSIDARLMNRIAFRADIRRLPLAGLGCMAGVAGITRVADYLDGHPDEAALLISCELSSGLWQGSVQADLRQMIGRLDQEPHLHSEIVMAIVTAALFGDGSGALLMVGRDHALAKCSAVRIVDSRSNWVPDTEHIMGLDYVDAGMRNILRPEVKTFVAEALGDVISPMLATHRLEASEIGHWTLHPGGPRIMDAAEMAFDLSTTMMRPSREALTDVGNISSATVLYMLDRILRGERPPAETPGLIVAMGPGFSQEAALAVWN
jgi:alkylresorcinol/alkylpyrone synthase